MLAPDQDTVDRRAVWDALQVFWMDTEVDGELEHAARVCAGSKYSLEEIEQIFWNEVFPAVRFNLKQVAGEWKGFEIGWLTKRILETNRFSKPLPWKLLHPYANRWWRKLRLHLLAVKK